MADSGENLKSQLTALTQAYEDLKQENYSLQCKLEVSAAMEQEVREVQEMLEEKVAEVESMKDKMIQELEQKHSKERKELNARISYLENQTSSLSGDNEQLHQKIAKLTAELRSLPTEVPVVIEEDTTAQEEISHWKSQLLERDHDIQHLEETLRMVNNENVELEGILADVKAELSDKKAQLVNLRDDVMVLQRELTEAKEKPASESCKGNSLFAEVEDRRKKMLDQMSAMRRGYNDARRVVSIKDAEIRALKAERSTLIRKWEDDNVDSHYQDNKLMEKYKGRISELESKLQVVKDKCRTDCQSNNADKPYSYFHTILEQKNQEVAQLELKLENVSIQAVLEEEMRHKLSRQLRYWRCKAMSSDAQLVAVKSQLEAVGTGESTNVEALKVLRDVVEQQPDLEGSLDSTKAPDIAVEDSISLEELSRFPEYLRRGQSSDDFDKSSDAFQVRAPLVKVAEKEMGIPTERSQDLQELTNISAVPAADAGKLGKGIKRDEDRNAEDSVVSQLKSALVLGDAVEVKKERKILKFSEDTVDPPARTLKRQATPKYPIIFASNNPKRL